MHNVKWFGNPPLKYVLEGRVVTMGPRGVLACGAIYIDSGVVKAVQGTSEPPPEGFQSCRCLLSGVTTTQGITSIDLEEIAGAVSRDILHLEIQGFDGNNLVAVARLAVPAK